MYYARCTNVKKMNCDKCVPVYRAQAPVRIHCTAQAIARDSAVFQPRMEHWQTQSSHRSFFSHECRMPAACMFVPITSEIYLHYSNDDCTG